MNIRERLEVFWAGERPDVIPFTIYQNEWRHTQDDPAWQELYEKGLGVTWHLRTTKEIWPSGVEFWDDTVTENGKTLLKRVISTPVGEVYELYDEDWRQKHFLETTEDYAVMTYLAKNLEIEPCYDEYLAREKEIAPYGVGMAFTGRTPNQTILVDLVGLEKYAFHLFDLEAEMMELYEALVEGARRRLRPVLMTTSTTVLAMLPLALGLGEGSELQAPLARVIVGGLITSTLITLVFVPSLYFVIERRRFRVGEAETVTLPTSVRLAD